MASALCQSSLVRGFAPKVQAKRTRAVAAQAKVGNWLPGSDTPAYLDNLPASYGFDPLGLGSEPASLARFQEAEVMNGRWAMLGVAGMLGVEALGYGNWYDAPLWAVTGGKATYFGSELPFQFDLGTLAAIEIGSFAIAESLRGAAEGEKSCYPGFNPAGLFKEGAAVADGRTREIKNGRLAMVAFFGMVCQHAATGQSPLEALSAHLSSPLTSNFATNGVSLPF